MADKKNAFDILYPVNVGEHTENKNGLTYLSWAWAWAEVKKRFPDANYRIIKTEEGLPYVFDEDTGYMVYTEVTIEGITHEMWLPVMDANNNAMKDKPYDVQTKYKTISVKPATMFDINKTIMRCLTKNLSMFGLGLYIYAGEDLPEDASQSAQEAPKSSKTKKNDKQPIQELPDDYCTICRLPVTPYDAKDKEGKIIAHYPKNVIIEKSVAQFGSPICMSCWMKKNARDKAKAEKKAMNKDDGEYQALIHEDAGDRV